jgi:hypothetical protein
MKPTIGEILQHIYDSEIHLRMGWLWDGGFEFSYGVSAMSLWAGNTSPILRTEERDIEKAIYEMADIVAQNYEGSTFAKWWSDHSTIEKEEDK